MNSLSESPINLRIHAGSPIASASSWCRYFLRVGGGTILFFLQGIVNE